MAAGIGTAVLGTLLVLIALTLTPSTALLAAGLTVISFGMSPPMVLGAQLMVTSVPKKQAGPVASIQDISASVGAAVGIMILGSTAMSVFSRGLNAGTPDGVSQPDLDAATESPGAAVALAERIGGGTGEQLVPVIHDAWSGGTVAAAVAALIVGVVTMVITVRGLRGVEMPSAEEPEQDVQNDVSRAG